MRWQLKVIYYFPDIVSSQVSFPALHITDDFVSLLAHCCHVQLGFVAITLTDMVVQTTPGSMRKTLRYESVYPPLRPLPSKRS